MPTTASEDDEIVMRAVEERVKQWKVCFSSYHYFLYKFNFYFKDIFKAKDDEIDDLKRKIIDLRDQIQMYPLEGQKTDIATLNKVRKIHFKFLYIFINQF